MTQLGQPVTPALKPKESVEPGGIVVLQGHPDPGGSSLCHALADTYADTARSVNVPVRRIEVAQLDFPLLRTKADFETGAQGTPAELRDAQADITQAQHLTVIYPLWQGSMPALLKGFIEQVFRPEVALARDEGGYPKRLMTGKSARIIVTMGMPVLAYRWYFGAHSLKSLERNVLGFSGFKPIRETLIGSVDAAEIDARNAVRPG